MTTHLSEHQEKIIKLILVNKGWHEVGPDEWSHLYYGQLGVISLIDVVIFELEK